MRFGFITLVVCGLIGNGDAFADPIQVSLEWVELDCSKCPELLHRLQPKHGHVAVADRSDPDFAALEKKAARRVLVHHVQHVEPGTKTRQTTRIDQTTFDLELAIAPVKNGIYETVIHVKRTHGAPVPVGRKPGTQLTPAQMKGIKRENMAFRLGLVPGQTLALSGSIEQAKPNAKVTVLVIGLEGPKDTNRISQNPSWVNPR